MNVEVRGKNIDVMQALHGYAEKRLSKLNKYINDDKMAQVALSREGEFYKVEVTIFLNGIILRGEEKNQDMYAALDEVVEKLERQFDKHKTKLYRKYRESGIKYLETDMVPTVEEEETFKIVRMKRFVMKPMNEEEAIMQMNLLGHNFFVFYNSDTDRMNIVYKRNRDNEYGLIEPEF